MPVEYTYLITEDDRFIITEDNVFIITKETITADGATDMYTRIGYPAQHATTSVGTF